MRILDRHWTAGHCPQSVSRLWLRRVALEERSSVDTFHSCFSFLKEGLNHDTASKFQRQEFRQETAGP
jgi:hypothetical protein